MTYRQLKTFLLEEIKSEYASTEAEAIFFLLLEHNTGMSRTDFIMHQAERVKVENDWRDQIIALQNGKPVQHIIGTAPFMGLDLAVSPHVLIPRPETEELVNMVLTNHKGQKAIRVLDIGTGSGCISIVIQAALPKAQVTAIDLSAEALAVAKQNATRYQQDIRFVLTGIEDYKPDQQFDVIISNPPYIPVNEAATLDNHVLYHEPHLALFAPDNDPLYFYKLITDFAIKHLKKPGGRLYFEAHHIYAVQAFNHISKFANAQLINDMFGKPRFIDVRF